MLKLLHNPSLTNDLNSGNPNKQIFEHNYFQYIGYNYNVIWKQFYYSGEMCQFIMGYGKDNTVKYVQRYYATEPNGKPPVDFF